MKTIEFMTPNGYKVILNDELSYGQLEDIQDISTSNMQIDPITGKALGIEYKLIKDSNKKALEFLLVGITKDGTPFEGTIRDMSSKDGQMIMSKVDEILKTALPEEKKTN